MIVGGIVFRIVTFDHPGDPALDSAGALPIRTEYLASEGAPAQWTDDQSKAHWFPRHLDAETVAKAIGSRCHAAVADPPNLKGIPERLIPLPPPPTPPSTGRAVPKVPKLDRKRYGELVGEGSIE